MPETYGYVRTRRPRVGSVCLWCVAFRSISATLCHKAYSPSRNSGSHCPTMWTCAGSVCPLSCRASSSRERSRT